jgi:hypothetical protein
MSFITPQSWMKPNHKIQKWMKKHILIEVSTKIKHHFSGINSTFSYWIVQNAKPNAHSVSIIDGHNIDISNIPYIVNHSFISIHEKLVFLITNKFNVDVDWTTAHTQKFSPKWKSKDLSKEYNTKCKYPIMHTNAQTIYSAIKTKNFDSKKVMFSDSGYFKPVYDNGKMGTSERCKYIIVNSDVEGKYLTNILSLNVYQFIVNTAKWSGFSDLTVLRSLPAVDISRSWTNQELYKHFNLTTEEIKLIEETIK